MPEYQSVGIANVPFANLPFANLPLALCQLAFCQLALKRNILFQTPYTPLRLSPAMAKKA